MQCIYFHRLGAVVADRISLHNQRKLTIALKTAHATDPRQTKLIFGIRTNLSKKSCMKFCPGQAGCSKYCFFVELVAVIIRV